MKKAYYDSCLAVHQHWEIKFWTQQMAEDLIKTHYVWFLPVWETYDMEVRNSTPGPQTDCDTMGIHCIPADLAFLCNALMEIRASIDVARLTLLG